MASALNDLDKAQIAAQVRDEVRAAVLGLVPEKDGTVSERGQFIIEPSNIEELENKKMRSYMVRRNEFPKQLNAWPDGAEKAETLIVNNRAEEEKALALGWSVEAVEVPGGRIGVAPEPVPDAPVVREFAAPGQRQPFDQGTEEAAQDEDAAPRRGRRKA